MGITRAVLDEVAAERKNQTTKWGQQDPWDGTGSPAYRELAALLQAQVDALPGKNETPWNLILLEEVYEALAETDTALLRQELIQVAAVAVQWIEALDRRCHEPD